ncbi:hypothetical protein CFAM422_006625 [Trichoderma lentiforme]|uniref:Uncharacterized protein n=1 Tax=Trichoderma lentiforme TaxID=1567552 RepID=A0A9P5CDQ6_9HYPO|nr:hypothetical protein CFAM422_006625 [Trichoderma lentiforme]
MDLDFIDNGDDDNSSQRSFHTANDYLDGDDNGSEYSWHSALTQQETSDQEDDGIQALGILPVEMPNPDSHPFSSLISIDNRQVLGGSNVSPEGEMVDGGGLPLSAS